MSAQNIYTFLDKVRCPEDGSGELVTKYLDELFSRISNEVVELNQPVDWLVVKSEGLSGCVFGSHSFFLGRLEKSLKEKSGKNISVIADGSILVGASTSKDSVREWIEGNMEIRGLNLNYINTHPFPTFVGYHLNMRE
mgnify:CR=1 FL=1